MWSVFRPTAERVEAFRDQQRSLPFTYSFVGITRDVAPTPVGFSRDHNRQALGTGKAVFATACDAIRAWQMFPPSLAIIEPAAIPIAEAEVVAVIVHALGLWFLNSARIVYVIDEPRRFGFAYGTLPGHAESGEERFLVEWLPDDTVWYDLDAISRPHYWPAWVAYPITRRLQRKFAQLSKICMVTATASGDQSA